MEIRDATSSICWDAAVTSVVGLAFSSEEIRAAEVVLGRHPKVRNTCALALPERAISWGRPVDDGAMVETLTTLWAKGGFRTRKAVVAIDARQAVLRVSELPPLDRDDLVAAARLDIEELLPFPLDDAVVNVIPIDRFHDSEQVLHRSLVVALPLDVIEAYRQILKAAKLEVAGFDVVPLSMTRATVDQDDADGPHADLLVEIGSDVTHLVVRSEGKARFVRVLTSGLEDETAMMASELEAQLSSIAHFRQGDDVTTGEQQESGLWHPVVLGIRSTIEYYQSLPESPPLTGAWVTGSGLDVRNLAVSLESLFGIPVRTGNVVGVAESGPGVLLLASAVGAALSQCRSADRLDVRTVDDLDRRTRRRQLVGGMAVACLTAGVLGMDAMARRTEAADAADAADAAELQLAAVEGRPGSTAEDLGSLPTDVASRAGQLATVLASDYSVVELLDRLSAALPDHTFVTGLSIDSGGGGDSLGGSSSGSSLAAVSIQGNAPDHAGVADWLTSVGGLAFTDGGWVTASQIDEASGGGATARATFSAQAALVTRIGPDRLARYLIDGAADLPITGGSAGGPAGSDEPPGGPPDAGGAGTPPGGVE